LTDENIELEWDMPTQLELTELALMCSDEFDDDDDEDDDNDELRKELSPF
jgi:hypothetical protein